MTKSCLVIFIAQFQSWPGRDRSHCGLCNCDKKKWSASSRNYLIFDIFTVHSIMFYRNMKIWVSPSSLSEVWVACFLYAYRCSKLPGSWNFQCSAPIHTLGTVKIKIIFNNTNLNRRGLRSNELDSVTCLQSAVYSGKKRSIKILWKQICCAYLPSFLSKFSISFILLKFLCINIKN